MTNQEEATVRKNKILKMVEIIVGIIGIAMVAYYIIFKEKVEFNSDYTDTLLWAEAALKGNGIYNKDFVYAYLLPFSGNLIMLPIVAIFGVTFKSQIIGMLIFAFIFILSIYGIFRALKTDSCLAFAISGLSGLIFCASQVTRMIFYGHVIHYSLGMLFTYVSLLLVLKMNNTPETISGFIKSNYLRLIVLFIWCILCMSNGFSIAVFFLIPVIGSIILEIIFDSKTKILDVKNKLSMVVVCVMAIGGGIGFALYEFLGKYVRKSYENYFLQMVESDDWIWDPVELIRAFLLLSTDKLMDRIEMLSMQGIKIIILMIFTCFILVMPMIALFFYKQIKERGMKLLILSHWILFTATMFIYNISTLGGTRWRLCGIYGSCVVTTIAFVVWLISHKDDNWVYGRIGYISCGILLVAFEVISLNLVRLPQGEYDNRYARLASVLYENGLSYGYGDFWSASVTTILSNSNVIIRPVDIDENGDVTVKYYQTDLDWYGEQPETEKYFVFASGEEYTYISENHGDEIEDVLWFDEDGYIIVYDHNLF